MQPGVIVPDTALAQTWHCAKNKGPAFLQALVAIGAGDRSRTYDLRITNALLYQLSYTGNRA